MILPMKKVCLVVQDKHKDEALSKLRETGLVHIEMLKPSPEKITAVMERKTQTENAIGLIRQFKPPKTKHIQPQRGGVWERRNDTGPRRGRRSSDLLGIEEKEPYSADAVNAPDRPELVKLMNNLAIERKNLEERIAFLDKEQTRVRAWGEFNPEDIKILTTGGVVVYPYEISPGIFKNIPQNVRYIKINEDKAAVRLLVLDREIPDIPPFKLPEKSISKIKTELRELTCNFNALNERIKNFADRRPILEREMAEINSKLNFELAKAELEKIDGIPDEHSLSCLSGYVPAEDMGKLKVAAAENNWALSVRDPGSDDYVPTKLRNNPLANLISPLTGFLEVVPGYNEADISGWFMLFFTIYFGMIFGDAAYGVIVLIAAIIGIFKTAKKGVPAVLKLMFLLGLSNFVWGMLTCTWFGMESEKLPQALQNLSLPLISNATAAKSEYLSGIVQQNLMILCFSLALLQLSIGHLIAITKHRSLKILAELGSIAMLIGMYGVILILIASNESRNLGDYIPMMPCAYILGAGFVFNFIFASYEGSIGKSILESCKNIISMILGIANVFSDIMSYIRLWAVGLAGAAIASTVNAMAGPMLGHFILFIFGITLIVFGHGLNLVLNALSVLVHGVRLNTLEFSGHVGLTWAGYPYKPFSENKNRQG
jgi:V/A-type H+-transporting ATPase subunit I